MKLLSLSLLVTGVLGAVSQYCAGFEDSNKPRHLMVEVGSDTSVLLYHIADVTSSNIPMIIDDQVLRLEPNAFGICTESKASQGHCDAVGTFMVKFDDTRHHLIINKFAHTGEKVNLTISKEGLYCAALYQEGANLRHIKVLEKHSYGYLSLPMYEMMKVFYLLRDLLFITFGTLVAALVYLFRGQREKFFGSINGYILVLVLVEAAQAQWKILNLVLQNRLGTDTLLKFVDVSSGIDILYIIGTFSLYYDLSAGFFTFNKEDYAKTKYQPLFKRCLWSMGCAGLFAFFQQLLKATLPLHIYMFLRLLSHIVLSISWISMVYIMWNNSRITHRKIEDPIFAKKYQRSRFCLICIPVAFSFAPIGGMMIFMTAMSNGSYLRSGGFGRHMEGNVTATLLEFSLNQNSIFVLMKHLPEFSMLFVLWAFLYIWKPSLRDKTECENIHGHELAEEKGEIKL